VSSIEERDSRFGEVSDCRIDTAKEKHNTFCGTGGHASVKSLVFDNTLCRNGMIVQKSVEGETKGRKSSNQKFIVFAPKI